VLIDGKVISSSTASGADNICDAQAMQDPLTGQWQDANAG
jgi:hypothetical protein